MMRSRPGIVGNTAFEKVPDQRRTASLSLALHRIRDTSHLILAPRGLDPRVHRANLALVSRASEARHRSRASPRSAVRRCKSGKPDLHGPRGDTTGRFNCPIDFAV